MYAIQIRQLHRKYKTAFTFASEGVAKLWFDALQIEATERKRIVKVAADAAPERKVV